MIGPNYELQDGPTAVQDLILPEDSNETINYSRFVDLVERMSNGEEGSRSFTRRSHGSDQDEVVIISYSPVSVTVLTPVDHSDFAAGCGVSDRLVYSLGIAIVEGDLYLRYEAVESSVDHSLKIARGVSIAAMLMVAILFILLIYFISLNIARPIIALTRIVKRIKNKNIRDEIPDVEG